MPPLYILYRFICLTFTTGKIITGIRSLGDNLSENSAPFNTVVREITVKRRSHFMNLYETYLRGR